MITDIYLYTDTIYYAQFGMMEITSGVIGGDPETFIQGSGGDYDSTPNHSSEGCAHFVAAVDFVSFACSVGEYAAAYWQSGSIDWTSGDSDTYRVSGNKLEITYDVAYERMGSQAMEMYFVNTL